MAPRKRAASSKAASDAGLTNGDTEVIKMNGKGANTTTNGHDSPPSKSPPGKRSKRSEGNTEDEAMVNGVDKGVKKRKVGNKTTTEPQVESIPEDDVLSTGNVRCKLIICQFQP